MFGVNMKKIFIALSTVLFTISTYSVELKSKFTLTDTGEMYKYLEVTCQSQSNVCQNLCGEQQTCRIPEVLCEDCVSQKSQLMYTIFTDINSIFKADIMFISDEQLIGFLKKRKFISIPHDIFLNMFTPEKKELLKKEFEKLCYINVESATLLATVNSRNQADELVGVICKDKIGSVVLPMQLNPDFSKQQADFWDKLNTEIGLRAESLKLKMEYELDSYKTAPVQVTAVTPAQGATTVVVPETTVINQSAEPVIQQETQSKTLRMTVSSEALEQQEPTICRTKNFSDGTSQVLEIEYYQKCVVNKRKKSK